MTLEKLRCAPLHFTVWTVIFTLSVAKITVHTVKCTGAHRNFLSATSNYSNAVFLGVPTFHYYVRIILRIERLLTWVSGGSLCHNVADSPLLHDITKTFKKLNISKKSSILILYNNIYEKIWINGLQIYLLISQNP